MLGYGYKEWGNMGCFENPIVVSGYVLCNIFYCIVKGFSLIHGVDPHFSRAPPLDRRDSLFIYEKLIFEKKVGAATYFIFILKGK